MSRRRGYLPWLALITVLGAALRFYRLDLLPPGLFGDEALVSLHARNAVATRNFPVYFAQPDGGFHPVVVYLTMLARSLTGNHPLAVRFGIAAAGVSSILITFFTLRAIFRLDEEVEGRSTEIALLGTFILAVTFPYILINRLGFEVMLPAPAGALVFLSLSVGLRTGRRRFFVLAGVALGFALYTYYSARLLPVAVVLALVWAALIAGRTAWRRHLAYLAFTAGAAFVVFAPLELYFLRHPDMFLARAITTGSDTWGRGPWAIPYALLRNTLWTVASLSLPGFGDVLPRHNLPGHPVYDAFLSLLLWLGLIALFLRARPRQAGRRLSAALLGSWAAVMVLPAILTMTGNSPHFTRMMGAMPALAGICALGTIAMFDAMAAHSRRLGQIILTIGFGFSLSVSGYDYFVRWAHDPLLFDAFQVGDWRAAVIAQERARTQRVYLAPELLTNPARATFDLLLSGSQVRHFPGAGCLVYLDRPTQPVTYIVDVLNDNQTMDRLSGLFPAGHVGEPILHEPEPWPLLAFFEIPTGTAAVPPPQAASALFGEEIELLGYRLAPGELHPGESLAVSLYWRALARMGADYTVFVHLYMPGGEFEAEGVSAAPVAQSDSGPCGGAYPTSRWEAGEMVLDEHTLTLPPDFAADEAPLGIGLYGWPSLQRLPVMGGDSILPGNRLRLTEIPVVR